MDKFSFNPSQGFQDGSAFPNPNGEQEVREQLQRIPNQLAEYINKIINLYADTDTVIQFRITEANLLQYRTSDEDSWHDTASGGHIILDQYGDQVPQTTKLEFLNTNVYNRNGITFVEGIRGPQGPRGEQGLQGVQGIQGEQGLTGPQGPQGEQGPTGAQGVQGIQGPQGERGPQGVQGIQGPKGDDGADGTSFLVKGLFATLADLVAAHPTGTVGDAYAVGTASHNEIYIWDTNKLNWVSVGSLQGPQGPQGPQGVQGEQGVQGVQGPKGEQGPQGATGATGATGPQGPQGEQGIQGIQGPKGDQGDPGTVGPGVPTGGYTGQYLKKVSDTDYDSTWSDIQALPVGGTANQVLVKQSSVDGDADWETLKTLPTGGTANQIIVKQSATEGDAIWQDPDYMTLDPDGVAGNVSPINADLLEGSTKQEIISQAKDYQNISSKITVSSGLTTLIKEGRKQGNVIYINLEIYGNLTASSDNTIATIDSDIRPTVGNIVFSASEFDISFLNAENIIGFVRSTGEIILKPNNNVSTKPYYCVSLTYVI